MLNFMVEETFCCDNSLVSRLFKLTL